MSAPLSRYRERVRPLGDKPKSLGPYAVYTEKSTVTGAVILSENCYATGTTPSAIYERCWDQNNREQGEKRRGRGSRLFRTGGPFVSTKVTIPGMQMQGFGKRVKTSGTTRREWVGGFVNPVLDRDGMPANLYYTGGPATLSNNPILESTAALESRAWDIRPKVEKFSLINALYEFKDVPGQLRQTGRFFRDLYKDAVGSSYATQNILMPNRVAEDYLNVQFGWIPFCHDIAQMADFAIFSKQYLDDITRGNNTWIKRKGTLVDVSNKTKIGTFPGIGCEPTYKLDRVVNLLEIDGSFYGGYFEVYAEEQTTAWAEGAFKYYRPEFDVNLPYYGSTVAEVNRYLTATGFRLSPSHVWKAIPWSWAIDWFGNVGKIIERSDAINIDGLVTKYLYLMHHKQRVINSFHTINFSQGAQTVQFTRSYDVKQRRSADSPYGFVLGGDLSATQWSILGALGLAKNVSFSRSF